MNTPRARSSCHRLATLILLLLVPLLASAFEVVGTVGSVDPDRRELQVFANGQNRTVALAPDLDIRDGEGKSLSGAPANSLLKAGAVVTLTVERGQTGPVVHTIRLGSHGRTHGAGAAPPEGKPSVGLTPLCDMSAGDRYKGEPGGLYGDGRNTPPPAHLAEAKRQTALIRPLDAAGKPAAPGKIGLVSISMSNATQEYSMFKALADADPQKAPSVAIVDCAQGGQAMAEWTSPSARAWAEADRRLTRAGVSAAQVQVVWVKLANKGPHGDLADHGKQLRQDTLKVLQNAMARFPNLRIAYLGSRIYGGYSDRPLNPEPFAYEGAFVVRWLIQDQIAGQPELAFNAPRQPAKVPLLLWGPYLWADGVTPRKLDGLKWEREDLGGDGTHPSERGRRKVADLLLSFFKTDPLASSWFTRHAGQFKQ